MFSSNRQNVKTSSVGYEELISGMQRQTIIMGIYIYAMFLMYTA